MPVDQNLVDEIVQLEWEMFSNVQSMDGPVSCQQNPKTFEVMRSSQVKSWNDEVAAELPGATCTRRRRGAAT